jgi:transcription elongation factor GreA
MGERVPRFGQASRWSRRCGRPTLDEEEAHPSVDDTGAIAIERWEWEGGTVAVDAHAAAQEALVGRHSWRRWGGDPIAPGSSFGEPAGIVDHDVPTKEIEMNETLITRTGLERLTAELEELTTAGRRQIAERLMQTAASEANLDESADYLAVREDQALLERRIAILEDRLRSAQIVEPRLGNGRIDIGERARLRDVESGERLDVELVGPLESDPTVGRISIASPLGQAIVGLRRGQIAEVDAPRGKLHFKVLTVEARPARAA